MLHKINGKDYMKQTYVNYQKMHNYLSRYYGFNMNTIYQAWYGCIVHQFKHDYIITIIARKHKMCTILQIINSDLLLSGFIIKKEATVNSNWGIRIYKGLLTVALDEF